MEKIVFLDRDGVINKRLIDDYVKVWNEFNFLPGVFDAIKMLAQNNCRMFVVSNQGGVAKGLYSYDDLMQIDAKMKVEIRQNCNVDIDAFYCPHYEEGCDCRKPESGLFYQAKEKFDISFEGAWIIGDSERDIVAGVNVGCKGILISEDKNVETQADFVVTTLLEAAQIVTKDEGQQ